MSGSRDKKQSDFTNEIFDIIELIKVKFSIEKMGVQFDSDKPNICYLKFMDNSYIGGGIEQENLRPL